MAEKNTLYKHHSYAACIGEGFRFLAKHLQMLSRVMLPYYTLTSVFAVLYVAVFTKLSVSAQANKPIEIAEVCVAVALLVVAYATYILANSRLFLLFRRVFGTEATLANEADEKKKAAWKVTFMRSLRLSWDSLPYLIWGLIINIMYVPMTGVIVEYFSPLSIEYKIVALFVIALLFLFLCVLLTPFIYTYYCRMMRPNTIELSTEEGREELASFSFRKAYVKGFRHKGKILGVTSLSAFVVFVGSLVLLLPGIISVQAYFSSVEGAINFNDQALISTTSYACMFIISTMAITLVHVLAVTFHASLLYLHGDILSNDQ